MKFGPRAQQPLEPLPKANGNPQCRDTYITEHRKCPEWGNLFFRRTYHKIMNNIISVAYKQCI